MGEIFIKNLEFDGKRVVNQISVSKDLEKFIMNHKMFVEYDEEIFANSSILNIPLTATMLPLAWLSSSDIQVSSIDKNFKESMDQIQSFFKKTFGLKSSSCRIDSASSME